MRKSTLRYLELLFAGLLVVLVLSSCTTFFTNPGTITENQVHHVVLVWLKDSPNKAEDIESVIQGSMKLKEISQLKQLHMGTAIPSQRKIVDDSFDVGIHMTFASTADMNTYLAHPIHVAYVHSIKPKIRKLVVYDF